jgi:outer membrane protein TolC
MRSLVIGCFLLLISATTFAQKDSNTLDVVEFLQLVKQFHPIVKQASIQVEKSNADILIARGAFNPIISNVISNKTFDNTNYYNYINPNIAIPTWYGIEVSAGLENLSGNRFDPSETVGKSSYAGISITLLKNLVIDKRRAYLSQAKLYKNMAINEQKVAINNILMEAVAAYWEWANAYKVFEVISKNYEISSQRFGLVKKAYFNGERAANDTIEALSQLQYFEFQKNESWLVFQNEALQLSAFLWQQNNIPYQLSENIMPNKAIENEIKNEDINVSELINTAQKFHPELQVYSNKIEVLEVDKKLKFQELLPKLDFKYNHLNKGFNAFETTQGLLFQNNFQYGVKFEMPLLFSVGRGEFKKAKLKIEETKISQSQKAFNISLKIKNYYNEFTTLKKQIQLQKSITINFKKLLNAEEILFKNGESSIFLINARELKLLEAQRKQIELTTKYYKTTYALQWSAGLLN